MAAGNTRPPDGALRELLVAAGLCGDVGTTATNTRGKIAGLRDGDPRCHFGLPEFVAATDAAIAAALSRQAGACLDDDAGLAHIAPERTLAGIRDYAAALADIRSGATVLLATAHPAGLLHHYIRVADALTGRGVTVLAPPLDGPLLVTGYEFEPPGFVRFVGAVGCVYREPGSLAHSHLSHYLDRFLTDLDADGALPDVVIADHGMAGAAIARGLPTIGIADVNDIPLLLAAEDQRMATLLVLDDNRPPELFRPVTNAILAQVTD